MLENIKTRSLKQRVTIQVTICILMTFLISNNVYAFGIVDNMIEAIREFIREFLVEACMANLVGLFDHLNLSITTASGELQRPINDVAGGGAGPIIAGAFGMVENIANTAIQPIAGAVLAFLIAYELIHLVVSQNTLDVDMVSVLIKWVVKSFIGVLVLNQAFVFVGAIYELGTQAVGLAAIAPPGSGVNLNMVEVQQAVENASLGQLCALLIGLAVCRPILYFVGILVRVIIIGRLFEIYLSMALAPLPLVTVINQHWQPMGFNYIKTLCAYSFQGLLMLICLFIYQTVITNFVNEVTVGMATAPTDGNLMVALLTIIVVNFLLVYSLLKTGTLAKSLFGAS